MTTPVAHPSEYIDEATSDIIRSRAAEAETLKDLHPDQMELVYAEKWFKMFVPADYGGLSWSLPEVLRMEEALSWADGSTGWVVTLCAGAGWFVGFLPSGLAAPLFSDAKACVAGSGAATGVAEMTSTGFEVSGKWKYASGSLHATAFTANCVIQKDGRTQTNTDGSPMIRAFLFQREEVTLVRHWNSIGMIATGSHSFEVRSLSVAPDRCFVINPSSAQLPDAVFQFPFLQLAESTLAINLSGMAIRFLDLCATLFSEKAKSLNFTVSGPESRKKLLSQGEQEMNLHRTALFGSVEACWERCRRHEKVSTEMLERVSQASHHLARKSLRVVDELYPHCGLSAANTVNEINRVWRNLHTASQHSLFQW